MLSDLRYTFRHMLISNVAYGTLARAERIRLHSKLAAWLEKIAGESDEFAIFLDEKTKAVVRLKTGESHSGWTLRQVRGREATLRERERGVIANPPAR